MCLTNHWDRITAKPGDYSVDVIRRCYAPNLPASVATRIACVSLEAAQMPLISSEDATAGCGVPTSDTTAAGDVTRGTVVVWDGRSQKFARCGIVHVRCSNQLFLRPWLHIKQNICKNVVKMFWCFILHVTTSENVFKMFYAKTFAKMLQNIFSSIEHGLKRPWLHVK